MKRHEAAAIILAAGKGTRMKSDLPKVVAEIGERPLIQFVLDATFAAGITNVTVVYGFKRTFVAQAVIDYPVNLAYQEPQLGTGHAVMQAAPLLAGHKGPVVVLAGDIPLIRAATIASLVEHHEKRKAAVTILTTDMPDPAGYGRILRDSAGRVTGIVEEKDATPEQKRLTEINSSIYAFDWSFLYPALFRIGNENAQREYYLTDTVQMAFRQGLRIDAIKVADHYEVSGVNTPEQLAELTVAARRMGLVGSDPEAAA